VVVGGYAHMAHMQHKNGTFRRLGSNEYGLRDVDIVMVPS
jgi:hypothetical protein